MGALVLSADANPGTASWQNPLVPYNALASGAAIPVTESAAYTFAIGAGVETNTLADPTFSGQMLVLSAVGIGGGTRVVTAANPITNALDTIITFGPATGTIVLLALPNLLVGAGYSWRVISNDGAVLS